MTSPTIFLIHSSLDTQRPNFLDKAVGKTNMLLDEAEWFEMYGPAWSVLREKIRVCKAVFVLKGPNIATSLYTSNWVSWEIGVAAERKKDVWVFESLLDPIFMPIAYLTDYVVYDPEDYDHIAFIGILSQLYALGEPRPTGIPTFCPFCSINYNIHTLLHSWNCPSCQRPSSWDETFSAPDDIIEPQGGPRDFAIAHPGVREE